MRTKFEEMHSFSCKKGKGRGFLIRLSVQKLFRTTGLRASRRNFRLPHRQRAPLVCCDQLRRKGRGWEEWGRRGADGCGRSPKPDQARPTGVPFFARPATPAPVGSGMKNKVRPAARRMPVRPAWLKNFRQNCSEHPRVLRKILVKHHFDPFFLSTFNFFHINIFFTSIFFPNQYFFARTRKM